MTIRVPRSAPASPAPECPAEGSSGGGASPVRARTREMGNGAITARSKPDRGLSLLGYELVGHRPGKPIINAGSTDRLRNWLPFKIRSTEGQNLPPRLREKIEAVERRLRHASGPLKAYGQAAVDRARGKQGADVSFAKLDASHLDTLVEVENQRNPDLNLRHFSSHKEFIEALKAEAPASFRAIFPQTHVHTNQPVNHHVMADVRLRPGKPPTVVLTESAVIVSGNFSQLQRHNLLLNDLREHGVPLSQVAVIETAAQKTPDDCIMYSLHYAIKAHKNCRQFDDLHRGLQFGVGPAGEANPESRARSSLRVIELGGFSALHDDVHAAFGADVLPRDFYKHGASLTQAQQLADRPDGRMAGRVNGSAHNRAETLPERNHAFRVQRTKVSDTGSREKIQFSASIDGFRLQEIERALAAAAGEPVMPSKSYLGFAPPPRR